MHLSYCIYNMVMERSKIIHHYKKFLMIWIGMVVIMITTQLIWIYNKNTKEYKIENENQFIIIKLSSNTSSFYIVDLEKELECSL